MKKWFWLSISFFLLLGCKKDELPLEGFSGRVLYFDKQNRIFTQKLPNGTSTMLSQWGYHPRFSPDGKRLAFTDLEKLWILDAANFDTLLVKPLPFDIAGLAWSPDSRGLAFVRYGTKKIVRFDWQTQVQQEISIPTQHFLSEKLDWSPATNQFVFVLRDTTTLGSKLALMDADGSDFREIVSEGALISNPRFSPDGKTIAYEQGIYTQIFLVDVDGKNKTLFWEKAANPCWSQDGTKLMATFYTKLGWTPKDTEVEIRAKEVGGKRREGFVRDGYLGDWFSEN